jgi:hypothetical protein
MARWAHADPAEYLSHMPAVADPLGGSALDHATAYCIEGHLGAALWLPPGAHPNYEALGALVERTVPEPKRQFLFEALDQASGHNPSRNLPADLADVARAGRKRLDPMTVQTCFARPIRSGRCKASAGPAAAA